MAAAGPEEDKDKKRQGNLDDLLQKWKAAIEDRAKITEFSEHLQMREIPLLDYEREKLTKLTDFMEQLANHGLTLETFVYYKLTSMGENQPQEHRDMCENPKLYSSVERIMDAIRSGFQQIPENFSPPKKDAEYKQGVPWCMELWFLSVLDTFDSNDIKAWTVAHGAQLFMSFIGSQLDDGDSKFDILVEKDFVDILRELYQHDIFAEKCTEYMKDKTNILQVCKREMTANMRAVLSEKCEDFYIIPRNGTREGRLKMYSRVFNYFLRDDDQTGYIHFQRHGDEPERIQESMESLGFSQIPDRNQGEWFDSNQREWTVPKIVEDFTAAFERLDCSLLLFCLYTHGINGHVMDQEYYFAKYDILPSHKCK